MAFTPEQFSRLKTLDAIVPTARPAFDRLLAYATSQGYQPYIVSAVRTCAEESGMTQTKVRRSWHVLGRAVDVELHARGPAATIEDAYTELGTWWEGQGGTWGGRWTDIYPVPHPTGWCGPPDMAGDPCHFQFTDGAGAVPESVWPKSVTACADVDALVSSYRASQGAPTLPTSISSSSAPAAPGTAPVSSTGASHAGPILLVGALLTLALAAGRQRGRA